MGIQKTDHKDEYKEILHWQNRYIEFSYCSFVRVTYIQMLIYNFFRLMKYIWQTMTKPWQQLEWIFLLSNNRKQMYTAQKIVRDFIYNVNLIFLLNCSIMYKVLSVFSIEQNPFCHILFHLNL